jgi:hypothetical protein
MPRDLEAPNMKLILLPKLKNFQLKRLEDGEKIDEHLMKTLFDDYKIVSVVLNIQNELYVRISCCVYNELNDYIKLRDAIIDLSE